MKEINTLFDRALHLESQGNYAEAEPVFMKALQMKEAKLGADHADLAQDYYNAGLLYFVLDRHADAAAYLTRSLKLDEQLLGADSPELLCTLEHLAEVHFASGSFAKAETFYRRFLELHARTRAEQGAEIVAHLYNLAEICELQGKPGPANDLRIRAQQLMSDELNVATRRKAS